MTVYARILVVAVLAMPLASVGAEKADQAKKTEKAPEPQTLRLDESGKLQTVSPETDKFLLAVAAAKKLVTAGDVKGATAAYDKLKADFPKIAGEDLDLFIKGEIYFAKGKFTPAVRTYDKILNEHRTSHLYEAALDREFQIATAYLAGRKKKLLGPIKISGYDEGIAMMEKIAERVKDTPLALRAQIAVAEQYERRKKYNEAHLKWAEIDGLWGTGPIGKRALLAMAEDKHAAYNKKPENRRAFYDGSPLVSSRSYYERYASIYPADADKIDVPTIIKGIDEQLAFKELTVGKYYSRTDHPEAAAIYYNMVVRRWPDTKAAATARELISQVNTK